MISVFIADDQGIVRAGLRMILEPADDIEIVGEAENGREAVEAIRKLRPDVALMDIRMPMMDGIRATRHLQERGIATKVLILTTYGVDENVYDALKAGASGFLLKTDPPKNLIDGVRTVARGEALLSPELTHRLVMKFVGGARPAPRETANAGLTERELEVLERIALGESNAEIGKALLVSEGTVKTHVARILSKLGLRDRVQVVVYAYENGLVR